MNTTQQMRTLVLGLGSPHGDDRVGWEVVALLPPHPEVEVRAITDPLAVTELPAELELLVVVDACRGAGEPGAIRRLPWPDPAIGVLRSVSSHGIGLSTALDLAGVLGRLPPRVVLFVVEGVNGNAGAEPSPEVVAAIPNLVARVCAEATEAGGDR